MADAYSNISTAGGAPDVSTATGVLPEANGGTGSATKNFVDLTTVQTVAGQKTFSTGPIFSTRARNAPQSLTSAVTTQAGGTALTGQINLVTASVASGAFVLPTPVLGERVVVRNIGASNSAVIFPGVGHSINALAANTGITMFAGVNEGHWLEFIPISTTQWSVTHQPGIDASGNVKYRAVVYTSSNLIVDGSSTLSGAVGTGALTVTGRSTLNGSVVVKTVATAISYTALSTDYYIGVTDTAAPRTITLPAVATLVNGFTLVIKDESGAAGTNNITIDGNASETIDGATTKVISTNHGTATIMMRNSAWWTV